MMMQLTEKAQDKGWYFLNYGKNDKFLFGMRILFVMHEASEFFFSRFSAQQESCWGAKYGFFFFLWQPFRLNIMTFNPAYSFYETLAVIANRLRLSHTGNVTELSLLCGENCCCQVKSI